MFQGWFRADSRLAPSQWETSLQSNAVSHWLGANLESALINLSENISPVGDVENRVQAYKRIKAILVKNKAHKDRAQGTGRTKMGHRLLRYLSLYLKVSVYTTNGPM